MEPRWRMQWKPSGLIYLGGTSEFDLWFNDENINVRVVWGASVMDWDFFRWSNLYKTYEWGSTDKQGVYHEAALVEALTYLRCFAPWVEQEMTKL